ncbi:MAG: KamA family protein [Bacteroidales bacterium]|nr:KamA family protein [Bacteroidales bacterium]
MIREESILQRVRTLGREYIDGTRAEEARNLLKQIRKENPRITQIIIRNESIHQLKTELKKFIGSYLENRPPAYQYYKNINRDKALFDKLGWKDMAAIRLMDYIDHEGSVYEDLNLRGKKVSSSPIEWLWKALKFGDILAGPAFFRDMLHLFRQFNGLSKRDVPDKRQIQQWMDRHPSGLDPRIIELREKNMERILHLLLLKIEQGEFISQKFVFPEGMNREEKYKTMVSWLNNKTFHLHFAIRTPEMLNEMLNNSLNEETMEVLKKAKNAGIPFFVNLYYLSLLNVNEPAFAKNADLAIRDYVFVSRQLVEEYGNIVAWEKEDIVEPGKPNAAGWLLPHHYNIHRRYPEVAILIPNTVGRACGGLCVSCQRMFDFQRGHLNFNLQKLKPKDTWWERLPTLLEYFENDSQLRDILITGGDALMSSDASLQRILDAVLISSIKKKRKNKTRPKSEKYAEMLRIRLGTRLPVYLPQRITEDLVKILSRFREKASKVGFKQFVIQTHFESPMEVTLESALAVKRLISAGWTVTNQLVFTAAASRRGHTAKLRKVLNDIGVLTYYTFTVKGYAENSFTFANNARAMQEQIEEKYIGMVPEEYHERIKKFPEHASKMVDNINDLRRLCNLPFLATDRNVMNLPGIGKSLTFRTIGITYDGRRILEFEHDRTRNHSPIIDKMGKVIIIESRSISGYFERLRKMGENLEEYENVWGYSIGETETRLPVFSYPGYPFETTKVYTNLEV